MKLPRYKESAQNIELGVATPLETFVYEYEPLETKDADIWRSKFQQVLDYVKTVQEQVPVTLVEDDSLPLPLDNEKE